jgi:hypothetical protein
MAAALPAGPGVAWVVAAQPGGLALVIAAAVIAAVTLAVNAATVMYGARQETRRKEIELRAAGALAASLARCIDDAHFRAPGLPTADEACEAARVRDSAAWVLGAMPESVIIAILGDPHRPASQEDYERHWS